MRGCLAESADFSLPKTLGSGNALGKLKNQLMGGIKQKNRWSLLCLKKINGKKSSDLSFIKDFSGGFSFKVGIKRGFHCSA